MRRNNYLLVMIILIATACHKDSDTSSANNKSAADYVTITVDSPTETAEYAQSDTVRMSININAPFDMHGYTACLVNHTTNDTVWNAEAHDHSGTYTISGRYINYVDTLSDMELKIAVDIDHLGTQKTKMVRFQCAAM